MNDRTSRTVDDEREPGDGRSRTRTDARRLGIFNVFVGLLGFLGPAVEENGDGGLVNTRPGLFVGVVAVNAGHNLIHVAFGLLGARASRDAVSARRYAELVAVCFGLLAGLDWAKFGFDRGVHTLGGVALNGWASLGHALLSAAGCLSAIRSRSRSRPR